MGYGMSKWDWAEREDVIAHVLYGDELFRGAILDAQVTADPQEEAHAGSCLLWLAWKPRKSQSEIVVCYISKWDSHCWGYKAVFEEMGIMEFNCPLRLLDITLGEGPYSQKWRAAVRRLQAKSRRSADPSAIIPVPTEAEWHLRVRHQKGRRRKHGAVHRAIRFGNLGRLRLLLDAGADVNSAWDYSTPLAVALRLGNTRIVRLLLKYGAKLASPAGHCAGDDNQAVS